MNRLIRVSAMVFVLMCIAVAVKAEGSDGIVIDDMAVPTPVPAPVTEPLPAATPVPEAPTPTPYADRYPVATAVPEDVASRPIPTEPATEQTEAPTAAVYRYLTCNPGSQVPLYSTSTASKAFNSLSRGTLVVVHEYENGRARITFGGWKGWVATSSLTTEFPHTGEKIGYRYAYDESGSVPLYRYGFDSAIAAVPNGAKVAITDMKEKGYTYVVHGAVSGWAKNSTLYKELPSGVESQEGTSYYYRTLIGDKPGQPVQLYNESGFGDWSKCGTLPEGTVVKVMSTQLAIRISYGGKEYYVRPRNIFNELSGGASNSVDTGITAPAPDDGADAENPDVESVTSADKAGSSESRNPSTGKSSSRKNTASAPRVSVEIRYLGLVETCVRDASGERMIATAELEFQSDAPEGKRIAYIYAPNTGKCSMWKKANKNSDLVKRCKAGTVVMVLDYGSKFCRIRYDGKEGYVLTSCLRFSGKAVETIGTGKISYKGKTTGSTTVNIRGAGNSDAHRIAEWRTGVEVTVFSHKNGWYEVEYQGVHGWVQEKFLTMNE